MGRLSHNWKVGNPSSTVVLVLQEELLNRQRLILMHPGGLMAEAHK